MRPVPSQRTSDQIRRDIDWARHLRSEWPGKWSDVDADQLSQLEDELIDAALVEQAKR